MERRLERMNWKQFKKTVPQRCDTVLLPVGTIEAHGPGALGTDCLIPTSLADRLCRPLNALAAPAVNYGFTNTLLPYPGSLSVSPDVLRAYVREVAFSLAETGFRKIIVLNGHGGNTDSLKGLGAELWRQKKAAWMTVDWWQAAGDLAQRHFGGSGHAGADELAALMAVDSSLVCPADYRKDEVGQRFEGIAMYPYYRCMILNRPREGYPRFDRRKAEKFMAAVVDRLAADIKQVLAGWEDLF
jgi:creatinine amidohydrolase